MAIAMLGFFSPRLRSVLLAVIDRDLLDDIVTSIVVDMDLTSKAAEAGFRVVDGVLLF